MSEWTPEATEYLEGYLLQVAALARSQGDDGDIIVTDLRTHITTEAEELAGAIVNLEHLRKILAGIGTPGQVAGGEVPQVRPSADAPRSPVQPPPPPPSQPTPSITVQAAPRSRASYWIFAYVALVLGILAIPVLAIFFFAATYAPNLLRERMAPYESAALTAVRAISAAQEEFQSRTLADLNKDGIGDYGTLDELFEADLISKDVAFGVENDYLFSVEVTPGAAGTEHGFTCIAEPRTVGATGIKHYYVDQTGVIRFEGDGSFAKANSPPIEEKPHE